MEIKIKYFTDILPIEVKKNSDWIDLRVAEDVVMDEGEFRLLPLGVAMKLPDGYEALVIPRSSTYKNYHVVQANSCGLIDNSYCGDDDQWMFPAVAFQSTKIPKNTRICQFRIQKKQPKVTFSVVEQLEGENRGGFGSSGTV